MLMRCLNVFSCVFSYVSPPGDYRTPQPQRLHHPATRLGLLSLLVFLAACTSPTKRTHLGDNTPDAFSLSGRFTVNYQKPNDTGAENSSDSVSGNFDWEQENQQTLIDLRSPFGQTIAKIQIDPQTEMQAHLLLPDQPPISAASAEILTQQQLGWRLPVNGLRYWLLGQANPHSTPQITQTNNRITRLIQDQWQVDYLSWHNQQPQRITLRWPSDAPTPALELRLVLDTWD